MITPLPDYAAVVGLGLALTITGILYACLLGWAIRCGNRRDCVRWNVLLITTWALAALADAYVHHVLAADVSAAAVALWLSLDLTAL